MQNGTLKLVFVGDIYLANLKRQTQLTPLLGDFVAGNLESVLKGIPNPHKIGPHLSCSQKSLESLKELGFSYLSLANNHVLDQGLPALERTKKQLSKLRIVCSGAGLINKVDDMVSMCEVSGVKIACISIADNDTGERDYHGALSYYFQNDPRIKSVIKLARKSADLVIVFSHGGIEEVPFPPARRIKILKQFVDWGADLVIGSHPHIPQGSISYKKKTIITSLGDYIFDYNTLPSHPNFGAIATFIYHKGKLSLPTYTYCKNGVLKSKLTKHLRQYLSKSSSLISGPKFNSLVKYQNSIILRERYLSFIKSSIKGSLNYHFYPISFHINFYFFRMIKLLYNNISHQEALFSVFSSIAIFKKGYSISISTTYKNLISMINGLT